MKVYFKNSRGEKLCGILSIPEGSIKITILCHGAYSNKDKPMTKSIAEKINKGKVATLRFDFAGHGESEGDIEETTISSEIDDLKAAVDFVQEKFNKIALCGSSFSGIVCLAFASKDKRPYLLALKSPVSDYVNKRKKDLGEKGIKKWEDEGFVERENKEGNIFKIKYKKYEDSHQYNYSLYESIDIPVFIVHGDMDKSVSIEQSQELIKHLKRSELKTIEGADHIYTKKEHYHEVIKLLSEWIINNL